MADLPCLERSRYRLRLCYDYNQDIDAVGAGKISVVFGDFSKYRFARCPGRHVVAVREMYMDNYQSAFLAFVRTDGNC